MRDRNPRFLEQRRRWTSALSLLGATPSGVWLRVRMTSVFGSRSLYMVERPVLGPAMLLGCSVRQLFQRAWRGSSMVNLWSDLVGLPYSLIDGEEFQRPTARWGTMVLWDLLGWFPVLTKAAFSFVASSLAEWWVWLPKSSLVSCTSRLRFV